MNICQNAKRVAIYWDYQKSWLPVVPQKGSSPLTKEELNAIQKESKPTFCYELTGDVVWCNNEHGGVALIDNGYLPKFFVKDGIKKRYCEKIFFLQYFSLIKK